VIFAHPSAGVNAPDFGVVIWTKKHLYARGFF